MTYRCAIGQGMECFGLTPGHPQFTCDSDGCTAIVVLDNRLPPRWLLDGRAPPGWLKVPNDPDGFTSSHYCQKCRLFRETTS